MTVEEAVDNLIQLKLPQMACALRDRLERSTGSALSIDECIGLMVDRESLSSQPRPRPSVESSASATRRSRPCSA
jgi:hypothetical protein